MDKKVAHIVSHSHWDREWYMPFEKHHIKLVQLIDDILELLDEDNGFCSFFLDGQTIALEDYLQIRPENEEKLKKYIKEDRIFVGPWYVLQDEFLTSSEANIRNLLVGMKQAQKFGKVSKIGYFPDAFGNAGQMPQILSQAGMKGIFFGRGVKPVGFDNQVDVTGDYESVFSEMNWQSPDGTKLLGVLFANWYCNGMEIPTDKEKAKEYWDAKLAGAEKFASSHHLLFMNGCDHQPVQKDLVEAIKTAEELYPDIEFKHSNFDDFIAGVLEDNKNEFSTISGELTSQDTDGWMTLVNTCSSRIYQKQANQKAQSLLEKQAEPLNVYASLYGKKYPNEWLEYSWKTLMQNHPHDSICGCSVDDVHDEMDARFKKSIHVSEELVIDALKVLAENTDTSMFTDEERPFVVTNTTGFDRTGVVKFELDLHHIYDSDVHKIWKEVDIWNVDEWCVVDENHNVIPATLKDLGRKFKYDLPDDKFRKPYIAQFVEVEFEAENVPANGVKVYALTKKANVKANSLVTADNTMENDFVKAVINENGTVDLTVKETGHTFKSICGYEETGDMGNEYIYFCPINTTPIYSADTKADSIKLVEDDGYKATFEVKHTLKVPVSADEVLLKEQQDITPFFERKAGRSAELVDFNITTLFTLEKSSRGLKIKSTFDNKAKDHRVRMLFPSALETSTHLADSIFEAVERQNRVSACWENPSNCQHQQYYASISDGENGLTVANFGLNEYEVLPDNDNAIAVTILRSIGEMGDWGYFPTPKAQCIGENTVEMMVIPHKGDLIASKAFKEAHQFQTNMEVVQTTAHTGDIKSGNSFIEYEGYGVVMTAVKENELTGDIVVRFCNLSDKDTVLKVKANFAHKACHMSNVIEEEKEEINVENGFYNVEMGKYKICTLIFKK